MYFFSAQRVYCSQKVDSPKCLTQKGMPYQKVGRRGVCLWLEPCFSLAAVEISTPTLPILAPRPQNKHSYTGSSKGRFLCSLLPALSVEWLLPGRSWISNRQLGPDILLSNTHKLRLGLSPRECEVDFYCQSHDVHPRAVDQPSLSQSSPNSVKGIFAPMALGLLVPKGSGCDRGQLNPAHAYTLNTDSL